MDFGWSQKTEIFRYSAKQFWKIRTKYYVGAIAQFSMQYYFDTSIWLDIYEKRGERGEQAKNFLARVIKEGGKILYSDLLRKELKELGYGQIQILQILQIPPPRTLRHVHAHREQSKLARRLARERRIPIGDALHAILARDNDAELISIDKDFDKLKDIIIARRPDEFI